MAEFDLIARIRARAAAATADPRVRLGIGDDAAVLAVPSGQELVVATDMLNAGVHFPLETAAADIGWKALAVNLSDLAAMGAQPAWCTLALALPAADPDWLECFLDGFLALAAVHGVALVGGDTTHGPLSVVVTAHGLVAPGGALRRDAARSGDDVWVSGTLGDAAGALSQWSEGGIIDPALRERLDRPVPRVALGRLLAGVARAAIDVSDGLLADLGHVCHASGVGAAIALDALPVSAGLQAAFAPAQCASLQACGGDDYELCFTAPPGQRDNIARMGREAGVTVSRIGCIDGGDGVRVRDAQGRPWQPTARGYAHFSG